MKKVLLVEQYDPFKGNFSFPAPSLGVWRICGFLRSRGVECRVFSSNIYPDPYNELENILSEYKPDIIGFSITSMTLPYDLSLIHWAKMKYPDAVYIGGGIGATFESDTVLSLSPLDYCIAGEGEVPMLDICSSLSGHEKIDRDIPGLVYKKGGKLFKNPNPSLDYETFRKATFSMPYDEMPISAYWEKMGLAYNLDTLSPGERARRIQEICSIRIMTINHCPFRCSFCSYSNFLDYANNWRGTKLVRLTTQDTIEMVVKVAGLYPDIKTLIFQDDLFVVKNDGRTLAICDELLRCKRDFSIPRELSFIASCRIDLMNKRCLEHMKDSGFRLIGYGVESFSPNILREYGKKEIYGKIDATLADTLDAGIKPFLDIILISPDSTLKDVVSTLEKCVEYIDKGCEVSIYPTVIPFAGSSMFKDPDLQSLIRYKLVEIPRTQIGVSRGVSIEPRREELRDFAINVERAMKDNLSNFTALYGIKHFPSRIRSLIFILSVLDAYPRLLDYSKDAISDKIIDLVGKNAAEAVY